VSYDPAGNVLTYTDQNYNGPVMGTWSYSYDSLNRLVGATASQPGNPNTNYCWGYDSFGNRLVQAGSSQPFASGSPNCAPAGNGSYSGTWTAQSPDSNNRLAATSQSPGGVAYDAAGDMLTDGLNQYLYDAEGRVCAVASTPVPGMTTMTGYIYDADGNRVAKGTIQTWGSCDPTVNGFLAGGNETDYVLGSGDEQVTELAQDANGSMNWQRTYVYAGGSLIATYDPAPNPQYIASQYNPSNPTVDPPSLAMPSFRLTDWLGTMRATTDAWGVVQSTCTGLPFGDGVACSGDIPDPHHFTGKERDTESGNDYFGARYYSSAMGRWLSPDWSAKAEPVPYAKMDNPQSLNLYAYVENNPLFRADPDGHRCLEELEATMDEVDAVAKPLIESAISGTEKAATVSVDGALGVVGFLFTAGVQSTAPASHDQLYNEETGVRYVPEPQTSTSGAGARQGGNGTIYRVPGSATRSGKPYIGRHNKPNPAKTRRSNDGRDRSKAEVVDTYNASDTQEGRTKEQQQIDQNGGVQNLDNKRNEIKPPPPTPNQ
jgi:RHS repeat-associated protein